MGKNNQIILAALAFIVASVHAIPVSNTTINSASATPTQSTNSTLLSEDPEISPVESSNTPPPDMSQFEEIKENEIPEGSLVLVVEEQLQEHPDGEIMDTASNVAFRPLFRYRQRQIESIGNRRIRRRYYTPRRSYRGTYPYYRPYRSISRRNYYQRPSYGFRNYFPVLS